MKTIINGKQFKEALKEINTVKINKEFGAITENVKIASDGNTLTLQKNNVNTVLSIMLEAETIESGQTVIDNDTLNIVSKFKNNYFTIMDDIILSDKKEIKYIKNDYIDLEKFDIVKSIIIESDELLRMLEVNYCVAQDEARPILTGVCFKNNKTCSLDGYRLSMRTSEKFNIGGEIIFNNESIKILKPLLKKFNGNVTMNIGAKFTSFSFGIYKVTCRLLEGNFIKFEQVIPNDLYNKIVINNLDQFKEVVDICELTTKKETSTIIKFINEDNELKLEAETTKNKFSDIIDSNFNGDMEQIWFNVKYVKDMLKNNKFSKLTIQTKDPSSAIIMSDNYDLDNIELILPVRQTIKK